MKNAFDELITAEYLNRNLKRNRRVKSKEKKRQKKKIEQNIQELWDYYKSCNIYLAEEPQEKKRTEEIPKAKLNENFLKLISDSKPQVQEAQRTPSRINAKTNNNNNKTTTRHIILKLQKIKDKEKKS